MDIGNKIKKYRERQNISQDELALKVFVSRQTVSNWETNKNYPDIKSVLILSNIFNVSLDELIKGDMENMKQRIEKEKIKEFNLLGTIYFIEMIVLLFSAYPLFKLTNMIGLVIWIILFLITLGTATIIEKFKKNNDIQTYKEIVAFCEGKTLTHDEAEQEFGKRIYQKILMAIAVGIITLIVCMIMKLILQAI